MVIEVTPGTLPISTGTSRPSNWLREQPYSLPIARLQTAPDRAGTLMGGPHPSEYDTLFTPGKIAAMPNLPITPTKRGALFSDAGVISLDMIEPLSTLNQIPVALGLQGAPSPMGKGLGDQIGAELAKKGIDPFSTGSTGLPARLADYPFGFAMAVVGAITNQVPASALREMDGADGLKYRFQKDPGYWATLRVVGEDFLTALAYDVASAYVNPADHPYLVEGLLEQFKIDRAIAQGRTSGSAAVDAIAQHQFERDRAAASGIPLPNTLLTSIPLAVVGSIPFIGEGLADGLVTLSPTNQAAWDALSADERMRYFADAGPQMIAGNLIMWLPILTGVGAVMAAVKGAGALTVAGRTIGIGDKVLTGAQVYSTYNRVLKASEISMAMGLGVLGANAALSNFEWYDETIGQRVDAARPISGSPLAGLVNEIGFWSSGTFGARLAQQAATRAAGATAGKIIRAGSVESPFYRFGLGGAQMTKTLEKVLPGQSNLLKLSRETTMTQYVIRHGQDEIEQIATAALRGEKTGIAALDNAATMDDKVAMVNDMLTAIPGEAHAKAEWMFRVMKIAREPTPLLGTRRGGRGPVRALLDKLDAQEARDTWRVAAKIGRYLEDTLSHRYIREYGDNWLARLAGDTSVASLERYAIQQVRRLGGDAAALGRHDAEGWAQIIRYLHSAEFTKANGALHAASRGTQEAGRLTLMRSSHVFRDQADFLVDTLRNGDEPAKLAARDRVLRQTEEGRMWMRQSWIPSQIKRHQSPSVEAVPPGAVADFLESITEALPTRRQNAARNSPTRNDPLNALQTKLDSEGLFVIAFKPVDANGNFIAYTHLSDGVVFRSPFLDYPLTGNAMLEMGSRGMLMAKLDGVRHGFRTWRITELQHASMYRELTAKYSNVTGDQIDEFYEGVLLLARKHQVNPQTLGLVGRGVEGVSGSGSYGGDIAELAKEVFGDTRLRNTRTGQMEAVDWGSMIGRSFRQSMKLNLTAGLTSQIRTMIPGRAGSLVAWGSDIGYVMWRFGLSPLFKGGEIVESMVLNPMRMGATHVSDEAVALFGRNMVGHVGESFQSEMVLDPMLLGTAGGLGPVSAGRHIQDLMTPAQRDAASMGFMARSMPETLATRRTAASTQAAAAANQAQHGGGHVPSAAPAVPGAPWDVTGYRMPVEGQSWVPQVRPRVVEGRSGVPLTHSMDPADFAPDHIDPDAALPEDRGMWHATPALNKVYDEGLRPRAETGLVGLGSDIDRGTRVSITTDFEHATGIADRMRVVIRAAHNDISGRELMEYFAEAFERRGRNPSEMMAAIEGKNHPKVGELYALEMMGREVEAWESLIRWGEQNLRTGPGKHEVAVNLDLEVGWTGPRGYDQVEQGWNGTVGFTGTYDEMLQLDWRQVGVVQVAARKGYLANNDRLTGRSSWQMADVATGPDMFEIQFDKDLLLVIDDRVQLPALADTEEELLLQLKDTLRQGPPDPNKTATMLDAMVGGNGVHPGMEGRAADILARLDFIRRARMDNGPAFRLADAPVAERTAFVSRLADEGWHPVDAGIGGPTHWNDPGPRPVEPPLENWMVGDPVAEAVWMERRPQYREAKDRWNNAMLRGLSLGKITPEEAAARGFELRTHLGRATFDPLPQRMYHATTSLDNVMKEGLRTRDELIGRVGLGAGPGNTVSFTGSPEVAERITFVFREAHELLNGRVTIAELVARSRDPEALARKMGEYLPALDPSTPGFRRVFVERRKTIEVGGKTDREIMSMGPGYRPDYAAKRDWMGGDNRRRYAVATRPMTDHEYDEALFNWYKTFLAIEESLGGPLDPLFFNTSEGYLKQLDPAQIGIVEARPIQGARGATLGGLLDEYRTWTGDAVTIKPYQAVPEVKLVEDVLPRRWNDPGPGPEHPVSWDSPDARPKPEGARAGSWVEPNEEWYARKRAWDAQMARGVSLGEITPERAIERGWTSPGNMGDGFGELPETLYHTTTAMDEVLQTGLMTRDQLKAAGIRRSGLGGGASDTISFTTDLEMAKRIADVFREAHDVLNGRVKVMTLYRRAKREGFSGEIDSWYGNGDSAKTIARIKEIDELPIGGQFAPGRSRSGNLDRGTFYTLYLRHQERRTGLKDPLFVAGDWEALRTANKRQIGVIEARSEPGSVGHSFSSLSEWRTWSGDAVTIGQVGKVPERRLVGVPEHAQPTDGYSELVFGRPAEFVGNVMIDPSTGKATVGRFRRSDNTPVEDSFKTFDTRAEAEAQKSAWEAELSQAHDAWREWQSARGWPQINDPLRRRTPLTGQTAKRIRDLDELTFNNEVGVPVVYRGVYGSPYGTRRLTGQTIEDPAFMAAARDAKTAEGYASGFFEPGGGQAGVERTLVEIRLPEGTRGYRHVDQDGLEEFLLPRGASLKIINDTRQTRPGPWQDSPEETWRILTAEYIAPERAPAIVRQPPADPDLVARRNPINGVPEEGSLSRMYEAAQQRGQQAVSLSEVAGTPEALFDNVLPRLAEEAATASGGKRGWWDVFWHPAPWKLKQANKQAIEMFRQDFSRLLELSGNQKVAQVFREMGIPEHQWGEFLMRDRELYTRWMETGRQADFEALVAHAGEDATTRANFDALYKSEDWSALTTLWSLNAKTVQQEAFGTHFFSTYRSALERTINHPLLGVYPASWSYKIAKEWAKFMFDNRIFGHGALRLGMAPMQAANEMVRAQQAAFALYEGEDLTEYMEEGPLGSVIFVFNLLLPGDWSSIPFPASRTLRDYGRPLLSGGNLPNPGEQVVRGLMHMGTGRDLRLAGEVLGLGADIARSMMGPVEVDPKELRSRTYALQRGDRAEFIYNQR